MKQKNSLNSLPSKTTDHEPDKAHHGQPSKTIPRRQQPQQRQRQRQHSFPCTAPARENQVPHDSR
ncbi:hypothetical protein T12_8054 [Trichinella patagoniensis]|uniref:Uncharacterized protein n=1 Tax=Trichinella patagoniensis TaxID=990121 RepID=A0A0V0Z5P6_9BILA|nr:hypothetical protein T12_8054 [Trichinella patagoniensis]